MFFSVHKKLVKSRFEPPKNSKSKELICTILTGLPALEIGFITIIACGSKSIVLIPFFIFLGLISFSLMTLPLKTGGIWMKEKILFIDDMHCFTVRRFDYNKISLLHIGSCPEEFRKMRKSVPFGTEKWDKYCEEQKRLEEKTLQENNYNEIISKYDNYVN